MTTLITESTVGQIAAETPASVRVFENYGIDFCCGGLVGFAEACRKRGLIFTAYCPLGRGRLLRDPVLADIAAGKGRPLAQIALRWLIQQGNIVPIPRSSNAARMAENLNVFDFTLTEEEMQRIAALKRPDGRIANPAGRAPAWD